MTFTRFIKVFCLDCHKGVSFPLTYSLSSLNLQELKTSPRLFPVVIAVTAMNAVLSLAVDDKKNNTAFLFLPFDENVVVIFDKEKEEEKLLRKTESNFGV
ncbi:CLUMA_CG001021, isoform A [Clunio marinus]|uniref:CLUMA_CG001021, isoform A n=1 Tax=Clunio marinus TaxID=568069 RepID=A0A1J1HLW9_9DIPT|nr:CLUMA_CG001021, isoform A [Clunio marinus]